MRQKCGIRALVDCIPSVGEHGHQRNQAAGDGGPRAHRAHAWPQAGAAREAQWRMEDVFLERISAAGAAGGTGAHFARSPARQRRRDHRLQLSRVVLCGHRSDLRRSGARRHLHHQFTGAVRVHHRPLRRDGGVRRGPRAAGQVPRGARPAAGAEGDRADARRIRRVRRILVDKVSRARAQHHGVRSSIGASPRSPRTRWQR